MIFYGEWERADIPPVIIALVRWQASQNTNLKYILKKMDFYLITLSFSVLGLGKSKLYILDKNALQKNPSFL